MSIIIIMLCGVFGEVSVSEVFGFCHYLNFALFINDGPARPRRVCLSVCGFILFEILRTYFVQQQQAVVEVLYSIPSNCSALSPAQSSSSLSQVITTNSTSYKNIREPSVRTCNELNQQHTSQHTDSYSVVQVT